MFTIKRLLVGLNGDAPGESIIRYAAMVARLGCAAERLPDRTANRPSHQTPRGSTAVRTAMRAEASIRAGTKRPPEMRLIALRSARNFDAGRLQTDLEDAVARHFSNLPGPMRLSFDQSTRRPLSMLQNVADHFDGDLLLVDKSAGTRRQQAKLAALAPCPVWLVAPESAPLLRKIIVPVDFSTASAAALRVAIALANRFQLARCFALHVEPPKSRFADDLIDVGRGRELIGEFETLMKLVGDGDTSIEPLIVSSCDFARAVARTAEQHSADLTIFTARRRSHLASLVGPSRAENVIRRRTSSTLVLRRPHQSVNAFQAFKQSWSAVEALHYS